MRFLPEWHRPHSPVRHAGSASSTAGPVSPTCRCWTPSGASVGGRLPSTLSRYWPIRANLAGADAGPGQREGAPQPRAFAVARDRMLREMAEAIEALTADRPLVLVLEDLHWSDHATLDLIAWLARRREPARLLLLGTYRPVDVIVRSHPLRAVTSDLALHGLAEEIPLELLSAEDVARYLVLRLPGGQVSERLARVIHDRTDVRSTTCR
jgi:AAA ATPase domain